MPSGKPGIILDVGGLLQEAAPREALDHKRGEVGAGGVQGRGVARGATADDDRVLDVRHLVYSRPSSFSAHFHGLCYFKVTNMSLLARVPFLSKGLKPSLYFVKYSTR